MKILVLNCGSSSIKYKFYDMDGERVLAQGGVERIGLDEAFIKVKLADGSKKQIMADLPTHKEGVALVFKCLLDPEIGAIKDLNEIDAVGHRVVQGATSLRRVASSRRRWRRALRAWSTSPRYTTWATCVVSVLSTHLCRTRRR